MASLIQWLAGCGARDSSGNPVASGKVWFFDPGTNVPQTVYTSADESATISQPLVLDAAGRGTVYAKNVVDILVENSSGAAVGTLSNANDIPAAEVTVDPSVAAGPHLSDALTQAVLSFGGTDFQYLDSSGATPMGVAAWMSSVQINVKAFGAKGDGLAIDTTAIQKAINRAKALGAGIVAFPPGTYLIDANLVATGVTGITFAGAGRSATVIQQTSGALGAFTISGSSIAFRNITMIGPTTNSTGSAITGSAAGLVIEHVDIGNAANSGQKCFDISLDLTSASSQVLIVDSNLTQNNGHIAARCVRANTVTGLQVIASGLNCASGGATMELIATTGLRLIATALNGGSITSTVDPTFVQVGSLFGGATGPLGSGAHFVPNLLTGDYFKIDGQTTGAAYVIDAPTPVLTGANENIGRRLTLVLHNGAGAPITGWTFNAIYHRSAAAISLVDTHRTTLVFEYDVGDSVWREVSISDST